MTTSINNGSYSNSTNSTDVYCALAMQQLQNQFFPFSSSLPTFQYSQFPLVCAHNIPNLTNTSSSSSLQIHPRLLDVTLPSLFTSSVTQTSLDTIGVNIGHGHYGNVFVLQNNQKFIVKTQRFLLLKDSSSSSASSASRPLVELEQQSPSNVAPYVTYPFIVESLAMYTINRYETTFGGFIPFQSHCVPIVHFTAFFRVEDELYGVIVMENLLPAKRLADIIQEIPSGQHVLDRLALLAKKMDAMFHTFEESPLGVRHNDAHQWNILVTDTNEIFVLDFGLSAFMLPLDFICSLVHPIPSLHVPAIVNFKNKAQDIFACTRNSIVIKSNNIGMLAMSVAYNMSNVIQVLLPYLRPEDVAMLNVTSKEDRQMAFYQSEQFEYELLDYHVEEPLPCTNYKPQGCRHFPKDEESTIIAAFQQHFASLDPLLFVRDVLEHDLVRFEREEDLFIVPDENALSETRMTEATYLQYKIPALYRWRVAISVLSARFQQQTGERGNGNVQEEDMAWWETVVKITNQYYKLLLKSIEKPSPRQDRIRRPIMKQRLVIVWRYTRHRYLHLEEDTNSNNIETDMIGMAIASNNLVFLRQLLHRHPQYPGPFLSFLQADTDIDLVDELITVYHVDPSKEDVIIAPLPSNIVLALAQKNAQFSLSVLVRLFQQHYNYGNMYTLQALFHQFSSTIDSDVWQLIQKQAQYKTVSVAQQDVNFILQTAQQPFCFPIQKHSFEILAMLITTVFQTFHQNKKIEVPFWVFSYLLKPALPHNNNQKKKEQQDKHASELLEILLTNHATTTLDCVVWINAKQIQLKDLLFTSVQHLFQYSENKSMMEFPEQLIVDGMLDACNHGNVVWLDMYFSFGFMSTVSARMMLQIKSCFDDAQAVKHTLQFWKDSFPMQVVFFPNVRPQTVNTVEIISLLVFTFKAMVYIDHTASSVYEKPVWLYEEMARWIVSNDLYMFEALTKYQPVLFLQDFFDWFLQEFILLETTTGMGFFSTLFSSSDDYVFDFVCFSKLFSRGVLVHNSQQRRLLLRKLYLPMIKQNSLEYTEQCVDQLVQWNTIDVIQDLNIAMGIQKEEQQLQTSTMTIVPWDWVRMLLVRCDNAILQTVKNKILVQRLHQQYLLLLPISIQDNESTRRIANEFIVLAMQKQIFNVTLYFAHLQLTDYSSYQQQGQKYSSDYYSYTLPIDHIAEILLYGQEHEMQMAVKKYILPVSLSLYLAQNQVRVPHTISTTTDMLFRMLYDDSNFDVARPSSTENSLSKEFSFSTQPPNGLAAFEMLYEAGHITIRHFIVFLQQWYKNIAILPMNVHTQTLLSWCVEILGGFEFSNIDGRSVATSSNNVEFQNALQHTIGLANWISNTLSSFSNNASSSSTSFMNKIETPTL